MSKNIAPWPREHTVLAQTMLNSGASQREIAGAILRTFAVVVTEFAISGKIFRGGLVRPPEYRKSVAKRRTAGIRHSKGYFDRSRFLDSMRSRRPEKLAERIAPSENLRRGANHRRGQILHGPWRP